MLETMLHKLSQASDVFGTQLGAWGLPASQGELDAFVSTLPATLPPDYQAFLKTCNGWSDWMDNVTWFSLEQLGDSELQEDLTQSCEELLDGSSRLFCICAHTQEDRGIFLRWANGTWEAYDVEEGCASEPSTFASFFLSRWDELESML